jgi:hypothetical protein
MHCDGLWHTHKLVSLISNPNRRASYPIPVQEYSAQVTVDRAFVDATLLI